MATSDKNIVITPATSVADPAVPKIVFSGADASTGAQVITLFVYPQNNGTLSFEGVNGQVMSITGAMSGTIYSVNDISGIPSIEVLDTGLVKLGEYNGSVQIGSSTVSTPLTVYGVTSVTNTTEATSTTTASLKTAGGLGVAKKSFFGDLIQVGTGSGTATGVIAGYSGSSGYGSIWSTAVTPSTTNYALSAGATITYLNAVTTAAIAIGGATKFSSTTSLLTAAIPLSVTDATDSTTVSSGAVYISGGLGVTKSIVQGATYKHYFDGGGDTYIVESSANTLDLYAGSANTLKLISTGATVTGTFKNTSNANALANSYKTAFDTNARIIAAGATQLEFWHDGNSVGQFNYNAGVLTYGTHAGGGTQTTILTVGATTSSVTSNFTVTGTTKTAGYLYAGTSAPTNTDRLNYDGYFYATRFYGDGSQLTNLPSPEASPSDVYAFAAAYG